MRLFAFKETLKLAVEADASTITMKQQTLRGFERYAKNTRRAQFLPDMQVIVP
jgi:hypothetical protein